MTAAVELLLIWSAVSVAAAIPLALLFRARARQNHLRWPEPADGAAADLDLAGLAGQPQR